jgi:DNA gyrase subunit A
LSQERLAELGAAEDFVLTVSANGFGKRTSAYEFRRAGRGGKGVTAMTLNKRTGSLVSAFPTESDDQLLLVSNAGQMIRTSVEDIRIAARATQGVTLFRTAKDEHVVAVERIMLDGPEASDTQTEGDGA